MSKTDRATETTRPVNEPSEAEVVGTLQLLLPPGMFFFRLPDGRFAVSRAAGTLPLVAGPDARTVARQAAAWLGLDGVP